MKKPLALFPKSSLYIIFTVVIVGGLTYVGFQQYAKGKNENNRLRQELAKIEKDSDSKTKEADLNDKKQNTKKFTLDDLANGRFPGSKGLYTDNGSQIKPIIKYDSTLIDKLSPQSDLGGRSKNQSVNDFSKYIVKVVCSDGKNVTGGSGTIVGTNKFIITNYHVIEGAVLCKVGITDDIKSPPSRWYETSIQTDLQIPSLDIAILKPIDSLPDNVNAAVGGNSKMCHPDYIELGDKVMVFGYPSVGGNTITVTEGVVSGFEGFRVKTSAKIEHGNSGGGAFLIKDTGNCWFGIPTSVAQGELESLGSIINYSLLQLKSMK